MKGFLLAIVLGLACFGCGNECDDAEDKLEECGYQGEDGGGDGECDADAECFAKCVNDHSCEQINSTDFNGPFFMCVAACAQ